MGFMDAFRKRQTMTTAAKPAIAATGHKPLSGLLGQAGVVKPATTPAAAPTVGRIGGMLRRR